MPPVSVSELIAKQVKSASDLDLKKVFAEMAFNDIVVKEIGKLPLFDKIGEYASGSSSQEAAAASGGETGVTARTTVDVSSTNRPNQSSIKPNAFDKEKRYQTPGPILVKNSSDTEDKTSGETESSSDTDT